MADEKDGRKSWANSVPPFGSEDFGEYMRKMLREQPQTPPEHTQILRDALKDATDAELDTLLRWMTVTYGADHAVDEMSDEMRVEFFARMLKRHSHVLLALGLGSLGNA